MAGLPFIIMSASNLNVLHVHRHLCLPYQLSRETCRALLELPSRRRCCGHHCHIVIIANREAEGVEPHQRINGKVELHFIVRGK